jgi:DNA polymerase-3 subunit gamma/tau
MLTKEASNALLKTLEEPPPHVIFILATTEAHKLLPTILSRCQRFDFHRLALADVVNKLSHISKNEGIGIVPEALKLIARSATGSMRDAENLLQQMMTYYGNEINLKQAQALLGISGDQRARELVKHIINQDIAAGITTINNVNSDGLDLRQFHRELVEYLRLLLLVKTGYSDSIELTAEDIKELKDLAIKASLPRILKAVKQFGQLELGLDNYSTLPLELALVDCALPDTAVREELIPHSEPEPVSPKPAPRPAQSPPRQKTAPPEEKKTLEPEPHVSSPVAKEKPAISEKPALTTTASASAGPLSAGGAIEQLQSQWSKIIKEAPDGMSKTPAAALLRSARPLSIENDTIVVSFKYSYHKEKMDNLDNQKTADKIVSSFLKRPCKVRCVYEHENNHLVKAALKMGAQLDTEEP